MYSKSDRGSSFVHPGRQRKLRSQAVFLIHLPYHPYSRRLSIFRHITFVQEQCFISNVSRRIEFWPKRELIAEVKLIIAEIVSCSLIDPDSLCKSAVDY